jgi:hypothetical protein
MKAHPVTERVDQGWQGLRLGLHGRQDAPTLQMLDQALGTFRVIGNPTMKGVRARARGEMTDKAVECRLIELTYSNFAY